MNGHDQGRRSGGDTAWIGTVLAILAWRAGPITAGIALLVLIIWLIAAWRSDRR
jgi:hypothetical protein